MAEAENKVSASETEKTEVGSKKIELQKTSSIVVVISFLSFIINLVILYLLFYYYNQQKKNSNVLDISLKSIENQERDKSVESAQMADDYGKIINLDQFTINLANSSSYHSKYVRVNVALHVKTEETENEVNQKMPQIRNTIIDLFNGKRVVDLTLVEGRDYLKDEIRNSINSFLVTGKIKAVYFTSFALSG